MLVGLLKGLLVVPFAASCPVLILINGMIMYSSAAIPPLEGTVAIHVCDEGYVLLGGTTKTCQSNGTWSGGEIACNCELIDSNSYD